MRRSFVRIVVVLIASLVYIDRAQAIGWDSDDFIISVGPSFITKIGVFDHDLTFKGYLDDNFIIVAGMDFNAAGQLVAAGGGNAREVRVYDSSGARVGGFSNPTLLAKAGQLDVAPNGNYLIASGEFNGPPGTVSVREFTPQGALVHEFLARGAFGASAIPTNRVWSGQAGSTGVDVYDLSTAQNLGTISIAGLDGVEEIVYDPQTNTVLIATTESGAVIETDLLGTVIRTFPTPDNRGLTDVTRGPDGDLFATRGHTIYRWNSNGQFVSATTFPDMAVASISWAGTIPEPSVAAAVFGFAPSAALTRTRQPRS